MSGTLFLVGGINDAGFVTGGWKIGLRRAGLPHAVRHVRWQQPRWWAVPSFADLWRVEYHRRKAAELAEQIDAARPHGPVHVLAHSAGTAVTAYALPLLNQPIQSAVFVGSGLSPGFDLSPALDRCERGILSVECGTDFFFLGFGTTVLGTCDRKWGPAAGLVGFTVPDGSAAYKKLYPLRWTPDRVRTGWVGGHLSVASPGFARTVLADWVRRTEETA